MVQTKELRVRERIQRHKLARRSWQLYLFLLLPLLYLLVFKYIPMLGAQIAFKDFNINKGIWGSEWVGLDNFFKFFRSYQFRRVVPNTLFLAVYTLAANFPIPIILALVLNALRSDKYKRVVQTITYMPHFISVVVLVGIMIQLLNPQIGLIGVLYRSITGQNLPDLLGNPSAFPHLYVWSEVWQTTGWNAIIYIAALAAVDAELHEAAQIDGAGRFKRILYIDLPAILPTATIMLILNAGRMMNIGFEKVFLMQNDLNLRTSEVISTYVYKVGIANGVGDFSYAGAIGLFNSVINTVLLIIVNQVSKKLSDTSLF